MKNTYLIKITLFIILSCYIFITNCHYNKSSSGDQILDMFKKKAPLSSTLWMDFLSIPAAGWAFDIIDSLIIMSNREDEHHFQLININNKKLVKNFGKKGRGPGEAPSQPYIIMQSWNHGNLKTLQPDQIYTYSIDSLINLENYLPIPFFRRDKPNFTKYMKVTEMRPGTFIGLGQFEDGMYGVIRDGKFLGSFIDYPIKKEYENIDKGLLGIAYQGSIISHPDGEKCVGAFFDGGIIHFLDTKKDIPVISKEIVTVLPDLRPLNFGGGGRSLTVTRDTQKGFVSLATTKSYVYAVYSGKPRQSPGDICGNNLLVFSWDGEPLIHFTLDEGIYCMFVDPNDQFAYGSTSMGDIVRFPVYMDSRLN